ncbi:prolyl-tRNA synthetase [bacterium]|nr:prolyl-tRNA synthetase [bacterium]
MLQSQLFTKTIREIPKDEESKSAQLLIRAGFIDKLSAGVYTFLPLGFRVFSNIEKIISEEIEKIGGQRLLMPTLIPKSYWQKTNRWKIFKELFKVKGKNGQEYGLGPTHEEVVVPLVQKYVSSYKDLPCYVYQIQTKFRDEIRVKSGLLRAREFEMKDLYSFHQDEKDLERYYERVKKAYFKILERVKLKEKTYLTLASGGTFSKFSHEFQTLTPAGEDTIYICQKCNLAINKEIKKQFPRCPRCKEENFRKEKAIEVANIFKLGTKYTKPFDFKFVNGKGEKQWVVMGCYGIGLSRLMGALVEVHHDNKGIIWPKEVAPFDIHLVKIKNQKSKIKEKIERVTSEIYNTLQKRGFDVLYDDRENKSPGEKLVDADLIGIPKRIIVSERTLKKNCVEVKERREKKSKLVKIANLLKTKSNKNI